MTSPELRQASERPRATEESFRPRQLGEALAMGAKLAAAEERCRSLEEQLRQSQKMETVGRLAGGVAHDFNNMLSVILSYGALLLGEIEPDGPMRDDVVEMCKAAERAAVLTRQLLLFSRPQPLNAKVLGLNDLLANMGKLLTRVLGADVDIVSRLAPVLGKVRADAGSVEQVVLNLVVNARDAMPTGGTLTLETANVVLDAAHADAHPGVSPGRYVMLAVTDTGTGIDKETMKRIFEPFFTTKEKGKGTGLGLSTVFGVARQSGGCVEVYTEPGKATTFQVFLPEVADALEAARVTMAPVSRRGSETLLLVEDDDQLRIVFATVLRKSGYQVIDARHAAEALARAEAHAGAIDLLLTDVVMPHLSGPDLARRLASVRPAMKVLCMSGCMDDSLARHGVLESHYAYLQKPIAPAVLTSRVREVLDSTA